MDDDDSIDELQKHVEHMYGRRGHFVESVEVKETFQGATVWEGTVKVFDLLDHPTAMRCYAWSYETTAGKRRFQAVLRLPPVDGPIMAVRAVMLAEQHANRR